jgi:hypothetical protein
MQTHQSVSSDALPPDHSLVIEGDFHSTTKNKSSSLMVTDTLCHHVLTTCGDNSIKYGSHKHVNPILCIYSGIKLMCVMSNDNMEDNPPQGNGTVCNFVSVKIKNGAQSHI